MNSDPSVAERAYRLWLERGRPHGSAEEDWLEAERQLARENPDGGGRKGEAAIDATLKESFPASDPAASHAPDLPPSNAGAKWRAANKKRATALK
jgi:Protein of unknown function (DUF2934)